MAALEVDREGAIVAWTRSAERMFGFCAADALGRNFWTLCGATELVRWSRSLREAVETGERADEGTFFRKAGDALRASVLMTSLESADGRDDRVAAVVVELDPQLRLEEALAAERTARAHLEARDRERDLFVATLAHDLRQPVSVINGAAYLLEHRDRRRPPAGEIVRRIGSSAAQLDELVNELLDVGSVRVAGEIALDRQPVDLGDLASNVTRGLQLTDAGRVLLIELSDDLVGHWDERRLRRIVQNLVENALQHSPKNSHVTVSCRRDGAYAILSVENECAPLGDEEVEQLFEPFHRTAGRGHTGLGLYIARALARAHGGDVRARWRDGAVEFVVTLPTAAPGPYSVARRHPRTPIETELKIGAGGRSFWAMGRDVSPRGLAFFCDVALEVDERVKVAVHFEQGSFSVLGTVRHTSRLGDRSLVGIEFPLDLSSAELALLRKLRPN